MKKLLSIILACSMLMSLCFVGTVHAGWEWVDFTYTENFDDLANGTLPEGWITSGDISASVQDGVLSVKANNWYDDPSWIFFENLGQVKREGLTIEMDFTRTGAPAGAVNAGNAKAAIALNGVFENGAFVDGGYVALHTDSFTDQPATQKGTTRGSVKQTALVNAANWSFNDTLLEGYQQMYTGATQKLKITYVGVGLTRSPKVYVNGVEASFTYPEWENATTDWPDAGLVGIAGTNSKFSVDNIKITGKRWALVPDYNSVVNYEKGATAFSYEENFDNVANGALPEGFKLIKASDDEGSTLSVQNGALEFYANNPWSYTYVAFENLGIVKRDTNLVIEMDLKKISGPKHAPGHAAQVGAAWTMAVEDGYKGSYVPVTGTTTLDAEDTSEGQLYYQREINPNDGSPYSGRATNFTGANLASGEVVKVKYVFSQNNRNAKVFFNGVESNSDKIMWNNWTANEGYVGLCGMNGKFAIDNIKITGYNYGSGSATAAVEATTYEEYAAEYDTYKNEDGVDCYTSAVKAAFNVSNMKNAISKANVWFAGADAAAEITLNTAIESAKAVEVALNVRYVPTDVELTVEKIELN